MGKSAMPWCNKAATCAVILCGRPLRPALVFANFLSIVLADGYDAVGHSPKGDRSWLRILVAGCPRARHVWPGNVAALAAGRDFGRGIAVNAGGVVTTGSFTGTADFDPAPTPFKHDCCFESRSQEDLLADQLGIGLRRLISAAEIEALFAEPAAATSTDNEETGAAEAAEN